MEFFSNINWSAIGAFLAGLWAVLSKGKNWVAKNENTISGIVLRVEKEARDDWSGAEKKQFAKDMFANYIKNKVPWYVSLAIKLFILPKLEKYIDQTCATSHSFKDDIMLKKNV